MVPIEESNSRRTDDEISGLDGRSVAVVDPRGANGLAAVSASLAHATRIGLFESDAVLSLAVDVGFRADVVLRDGGDRVRAERHDVARHESDGRSVVFFSSGSTGHPKLIERSIASLDEEARRYVDAGCLRPDDRLLLAAPMFHAYGAGVLAGALLAGTTVVAVDAGDLGAISAGLRESSVAAILPVQARLIGARRSATGSVGCRLVMAGAGAVTDAIAERFEDRVGVPLGRNYGSTETGALTWSAGPLEGFAVGDPFPGVEIEILRDIDVAGSGSAGEVVASGPGWERRMGDLGEWSPVSGALRVLGRLDGAARRNGKFVPTKLIEARLEDDAAVSAAVVRVDGEERLVAELYGRFDERRVRDRLRDELGPWAVPDVVTELAEAPITNAAGKRPKHPPT